MKKIQFLDRNEKSENKKKLAFLRTKKKRKKKQKRKKKEKKRETKKKTKRKTG